MSGGNDVLYMQTNEEELPPWITSERERKMQSEEGSDLPFPVYLIGSALVAIAAVRPIAPHTCAVLSSTGIVACLVKSFAAPQYGRSFRPRHAAPRNPAIPATL